MPAHDWHDIAAEARARNPLTKVLEGYGVRLRRSGRGWTGTCPLHTDGRQLLYVASTEGSAPESLHCSGCGLHGDVIDFVARAEGLEWHTAALLLTSGALRNGRKDDAVLTAEERAAIYVAWEACRRHLHEPRAQKYLARRGIPMEAAERLGLGYWVPGTGDILAREGLAEAALKIGLLRGAGNDYWEPFDGRVIIPHISREWGPCWLTGRATDDETQPKYLNLSLPKPLLGIDLVEGEEVALVEGPLDWVAAKVMGLPAAATLGGQLSPPQLMALARLRRIFIIFDADEAGRKAAQEAAEALGKRAAIVGLPEGAKDVADLLLVPGGQEKLQKIIALLRRRW